MMLMMMMMVVVVVLTMTNYLWVEIKFYKLRFVCNFHIQSMIEFTKNIKTILSLVEGQRVVFQRGGFTGSSRVLKHLAY
jgi:hypothetical protein